MPKVCPVCNTTYPESNAFCPLDGTTLRLAEVGEGLIGSVVADRYLVTELLGEGGMGKVYLARHVRLPQQAAIKILRTDLVRDPSAVARFNREASNASQVEQEHVARVYDYGETADGMVYLAMEYVPGKTLRQIIEEEGPLPPRRVAELVRQIAEGLDAAHHLPKPLIHRDLKPDNVLVVATPNGRDRVKVVDFGIAKAFGADDRNLTRTGFVVGTPDFMSPEQLLGEPLDPRSDVYALALVAFECLTGTLPFDMTTPERARLGRLVEAPRHLLDRAPGVEWPAALDAVFDSALARDREARPESAGEFAELFVEAVNEGWPATTSQSMRAARRTPSATPIPATTQTAVPTPVPTPVPAPPPAPPAAAAPARIPRSPAPAPSRRTPVVAALVGVAVIVAGVLWARGPTPAGEARADAPPAVEPVPSSTPPAATPAPLPAPTPAPPARPAPASAAATRADRDSAAAAGRDARREAAALADSARDSTATVAGAAPTPSRSLDSLVTALESGQVDAAQARSLAESVRGLLPRLDRDGRARAHIGLVRASILSGDIVGACEAVRAATAVARRAAQQAEIKRLDEQLGCD